MLVIDFCTVFILFLCISQGRWFSICTYESIGIISINSSWRSVDDNSNGNLLFPYKLLDEALNYTRNCKRRFFLMHHPIYWFKEFNQLILQRNIYRHCDIMFSGHIHESEITTHYKEKNGICGIVSQAALSNNKFSLGFSRIRIIKFLFIINHFSKKKGTKFSYLV